MNTEIISWSKYFNLHIIKRNDRYCRVSLGFGLAQFMPSVGRALAQLNLGSMLVQSRPRHFINLVNILNEFFMNSIE